LPKVINVKGFIIPQEYEWAYAWMGYPYTTAAMVNKGLEEAKGEEVEVHINSYGGSTYVGSEIYTALKGYKGKVLNKIVGLAASAASIVAQASECWISPTGEMMIHCASTGNEGNYRVMDDTSQMLQVVDKTLVNAYRLKTGMSEEEIKDLMDKETWLSPQQALKLKLVDKIMFVENGELDDVIPEQAIAALHEGFAIPKTDIVNELIKCGNVEAFKERFMSNFTKGQHVPMATLDDKSNNKDEGEKHMTLDEFKEQHTDLFNQIQSSAKDEGAQEERERIKNIEMIAVNISDELVQKAKFEEPMNAEKLAFLALQDDKSKASHFMNNLSEDSKNSGANGVVTAGDTHLTNNEEKKQEKISALATCLNSDKRRVK
jgi:ATP-dependent protease ClpP protease subunit